MAGIIALSCSEKQIQMVAQFLQPIPLNGKQSFHPKYLYLASLAGGIDSGGGGLPGGGGGGLVTPGGGGGGEPGGGGGIPASLARTGLE
jgi:hypothetical protein